MMPHIQQSNTILYCDHWSATVAFYRDILKFPIHFQNDWFVEFQLTPSSYLSIADASRATIDSAAGAGITLTFRVDDIHEAHAELEGQAVEVTAIQQKWGAHVFYVHDPEGHRIELWERIGEH